jgi:hypothetical protein
MVTDNQIRRLRILSKVEQNQEIAAAKAGMDAKTARRYLRTGKLPSERNRDRSWRTRADPFDGVWEEVTALLKEGPGLEAKTLLEEMQRRYPGRFADGQLRTLQRRVKVWRALEGPAKEVFFRQRHDPGRLSASDFTHMTELNITIQGRSFPHLVYHFVLTYSNWETGTICYSETFESLAEGMQNALWELGRVPVRHRTDRLSAAVNNMSDPREFTQRYEELLAHYRLQGEKTQPSSPHENGDAEQSHFRLKSAMEQALLLRGSRDFSSIEDYADFLRKLFAQRNAGRTARLREEMAAMRELPDRRLDACRTEHVRVDPGSLVLVDRNIYSVPSRLIGERVEARLYVDRVEIWYAQRKVEQLPRLRGRRKHRVDYRHIIDWLVRKPGAFENYQYRDELFPTSRFRMAYDVLVDATPARAAKEYLLILELAAKQSEDRVDNALLLLLERDNAAIDHLAVKALLAADAAPAPGWRDVDVAAVDLRMFDQLCGGEVVQ